MDKAVVLVSGGINSAVAAAVAREHYETSALHFSWGHRCAGRERAAFEEVTSFLDFDKKLVLDFEQLGEIGANARVNRRMAIEDAATLTQATPATFAAGVLPAMLSVAAAWADRLNAARIIVGLSEDHRVPLPPVSKLYPDHRIEFIQAFSLMLRYALPAERGITVEAPLMELSRSEIVLLGNNLGVPFAKTWSCYTNSDTPCGRCRPCVTRTAGFLEARVPDPLSPQPAGV